MEKRDIQGLVGKVVAYRDRSAGSVFPARILDGRLWEKHRYPPQVVLSTATRATRQKGVQIGYPVLAPQRGILIRRGELKELEKFLAETTLTMKDVVEQGENFLCENDRVIFKVVFPHDLHADYPAVRRQRFAEKLALQQELNAEASRHESLRRKTVELSNALAALGVKSPDKRTIVSASSLSPQRANLAVGTLEELIRFAAPLIRGCVRCGERGFVMPYESGDGTAQMLCARCHPRIG